MRELSDNNKEESARIVSCHFVFVVFGHALQVGTLVLHHVRESILTTESCESVFYQRLLATSWDVKSSDFCSSVIAGLFRKKQKSPYVV